jgi:Tfp pilus assembly protein PilO
MAGRLPRLDIRRGGRRIVMLLGALVVLNAAFYVGLVQPQVREYQSLTEAREPLGRLSERQQQVETHEAFRQAVGQAESDLRDLRESILSTRDLRLVDVQEELERLCAQFGIDLNSVGYDNDLLLDEELDRFVMKVPLEGNYASLRKFLQAVEDSEEFLVVERVSLARGKEGGRTLSLSINLATYFVAPEDVLARKHAMERRRGRRGS